MAKHHYMRQEYLWRSATAKDSGNGEYVASRIPKLDLESIPDWGTPYNLLDLIGPHARKIALSQLDSRIDTQNEWNEFVEAASQLDLLVLVGHPRVEDNPIISEFANAEAIHYLTLLETAGVTCYFKSQ